MNTQRLLPGMTWDESVVSSVWHMANPTRVYSPRRCLPPTQKVRRERWRRVLRQDPCSHCGRNGGTVDHIVARHHRGGNGPTNLTGTCPECNQAKQTATLLGMIASYPVGRRVPAGADASKLWPERSIWRRRMSWAARGGR